MRLSLNISLIFQVLCARGTNTEILISRSDFLSCQQNFAVIIFRLVIYIASTSKNTLYKSFEALFFLIQNTFAPFRFSIDLLCASKQQQQPPDIGFHFNPRLEQRYIVRNCRVNGRWGSEETTSSSEFDMERNMKYDLTFLIAENQFLVSINGKHFCAFTYRAPLSQFTAIEVRGIVDVRSINYKTLNRYPEVNEESLCIIPTGTIETIPETKFVSLKHLFQSFCVLC